MIDPRTVPIAEIVEAYSSLSPQQKAVADYISQGLGAKQIGPKLGISPRTVEIHTQQMLRKLNAPKAIVAAVMIYRAQQHLAALRAEQDALRDTLSRVATALPVLERMLAAADLELGLAVARELKALTRAALGEPTDEN